MARMLEIHKLIVGTAYPNCRSLGESLEVSTKTVQRDLDFMRDRLGLPLAYDRAKHGYFYTEPVSSFPTIQITHGELVALLVAQKAVEPYRGTPFEAPLRTAFEKLVSGIDGESGIALHDLVEAISFRPQGVPAKELGQFQALAKAVLDSVEVEFDYLALQGAATRRLVRPYHLGCVANQWYLFGFDPGRDAMRTFALTRLSNVRITGNRFERPPDFSVADMLAGSFSAFESGTIEVVRLKLSPIAARLASERTWHPTQEITQTDDGGAELTLRVALAPDLENWILGWGDQAEVISPEPLRKKIGLASAAMTKLYTS